MQAIETTAQIDQLGNLKLLTPLRLRNQKVRVIILLPEGDEIDDKSWLLAIQNPAFDFLNEPEEDIYSIQDGIPFAKIKNIVWLISLFLTFAPCSNQSFPTVLLFASVCTPDEVRLFGKTETPAGVHQPGFCNFYLRAPNHPLHK